MKTTTTVEIALQKVKQYCAYRERCHNETKQKLFGYGLYRDDVERIMSLLIEENFLNEERFATSFVLGHFRLKKWGKIKIQYYLKQKRVNQYVIQMALKAIDMSEYRNTISSLIEQQWVRHAKNTFLTRYAKTTHFLLQKGFEQSFIREALEAYK